MLLSTPYVILMSITAEQFMWPQFSGAQTEMMEDGGKPSTCEELG